MCIRDSYNSTCFRLVAHEPFVGRAAAIHKNYDIASTTQVFERLESRAMILQTDIGKKLQGQIDELVDLVAAFRSGAIVESHKT